MRRPFVAALLSLAASVPSWAATALVVRVASIRAPLGQIGCSPFAAADGFPMDITRAKQLWVLTQAGGATCRFKGLEPGPYAVSIGHDVNGNRRVDTNFVGMPTEQWGVSNNSRPTLPAPRFDETMFTVPAGAPTLELRIEVAK